MLPPTSLYKKKIKKSDFHTPKKIILPADTRLSFAFRTEDVHLVWPHGLKFLLSSVHHEIHHGAGCPVKEATIIFYPTVHFLFIFSQIQDIDGIFFSSLSARMAAPLSRLLSPQLHFKHFSFFFFPFLLLNQSQQPNHLLKCKFLQLKDMKKYRNVPLLFPYRHKMLFCFALSAV